MLTKRIFIAVAAAALVAACTNTTDLSRSGSEMGPLMLNAVNVDTSGLELVAEGRTINKTRAELARDLTAAIEREALQLSDPNGLPVDVNVVVNKVYLAPLIERTVAGTSYVESTISLADAANGSTVIAPTKVIGNSDTLRAVAGLGAVGAIANADVELDYLNTVNGYAKALIASLQAAGS